MILTTKVKAHIVAEFKSGVSMLECDRRHLQKPGTTERIVRAYMNMDTDPVCAGGIRGCAGGANCTSDHK